MMLKGVCWNQHPKLKLLQYESFNSPSQRLIKRKCINVGIYQCMFLVNCPPTPPQT